MKFSKIETIVILFLSAILIISIIFAPKDSYISGNKDTGSTSLEVSQPEEITAEDKEHKSNRPIMEAPFEENDFSFENKSFVATVVEETTEYMIVEPAKYEVESSLSDRITIVYPTDHVDYLYGVGRRVIINYVHLDQTPYIQITTDNILTDGYTDFEISVKAAENKQKIIMLTARDIDAFDDFPDSNDENLYYYGLAQVNVSVDGETMPLTDALAKGYVTLDGIIAKCNSDVSAGTITEINYDDGGSSVYKYADYTVIKYHTLDGNRDVYIGSADMTINVSGIETSYPEQIHLPIMPVNARSTELNGRIYYDTGAVSEALRCGMTDGNVSVDGNEYGYQVSGENTIDVNIDGKWCIFEAKDDWGLTLTLQNVKKTGLTYVFTQTGGNPKGSLQFGSEYTVEKLIDGAWSALPIEFEAAWTSEAYLIPAESDVMNYLDWEWLYGELDAGTYRFGKSVMDFIGTGNFESKMYYAEFEIA